MLARMEQRRGAMPGEFVLFCLWKKYEQKNHYLISIQGGEGWSTQIFVGVKKDEGCQWRGLAWGYTTPLNFSGACGRTRWASQLHRCMWTDRTMRMGWTTTSVMAMGRAAEGCQGRWESKMTRNTTKKRAGRRGCA